MRPVLFLFLMMMTAACGEEEHDADLALWQHLPLGVWHISELITDTGDVTSTYSPYNLDFKANENVYVTGSTEFAGLWWVTDSTAGLTSIEFSFSAASPFAHLNGEWIENTRTDDEVIFDRLYGTTDLLTVSRTP